MEPFHRRMGDLEWQVWLEQVRPYWKNLYSTRKGRSSKIFTIGETL